MIYQGEMLALAVMSRLMVANYEATMPYALITIRDPSKTLVVPPASPHLVDLLGLSFWDLDEPKGDFTEVFSDDQAKIAVDFVKRILPKVELIICQCEAGICRSAGMAAAISKWLNGDDQFFFEREYRPNSRVYSKMLEAAFLE